MPNYKKPKCPDCHIALVQVYTRIGDKERAIGYLCKTCRKYYILKGYREFEESLYIGLKEIE